MKKRGKSNWLLLGVFLLLAIGASFLSRSGPHHEEIRFFASESSHSETVEPRESDPVSASDVYTIDLNLTPEVVEYDSFINYGTPISFEPAVPEDTVWVLEDREIRYQPLAIPSSETPVDESTFLEPGQVLQVEWRGTWWAGQVTSVDAQDQISIRYFGWDDSHNETVGRERLQLDPKAHLKAAALPESKEEIDRLLSELP